MPRPQQPGLTENELDVMKVLWNESPLKVKEILERISRPKKPAYTSLLTLVQTMEKKGYVDHVQDGKAFAYKPQLKKKSFLAEEVKRVSKRLFDGNPLSLVANLIKNDQLSKKQIEELKQLLEDQ